MSATPRAVSATPRVSLLMPNHNNARILDHVLDRLATNTTYPDVELVVIDDGSSDGSREILRRWERLERLPGLRLIEQEHRGVIEALNAGLRQATGELVVQLDADASLETPGWLEQMVQFFCSDERIGVLTAKVVFDWGEIHTCGVNLIEPAGLHGRGSVITEPVGRRTYHERVARFREGECPDCEIIAEVDAGAGCCMMFRREAALEAGGYDRAYAPVWFDDLDLTIAIRRLGLKVFFTPNVRVVHHVGQRVADEPARRRAVELLRGGVRRAVPPEARHRVARAIGMDPLPRRTRARLRHHYAYWRAKWGFDLLNPDMEDIARRWGDTELCWRLDPERRRAGEQIAAASSG